MQTRMRGVAVLALIIPVATLVNANQTVPPPAGLKFKIAFTQPIDTSTAAVGDRIQGMLRTSIPGEPKHAAWAKEGSVVTARIVAIEHEQGPKAAVRVEVKLESAEVAGMTVALKAEANPGNDSAESGQPLLRVNSGTGVVMRGAASEPPHRGSLHEDPGVYVFEFHGSARDAKVGAGLVSSWVTVQ